ncbi:MAG: S41 family peptidase [Rikenellaceae bacterium]
MRKSLLFTLLLTVAMFAACRKESPEVVHPSENSYTIYTENYWSNLFDNYWSAMSQSYCFWRYESLDWDAIYDEYIVKFAECDALCMGEPDEYFVESSGLLNLSGDTICYGDSIAIMQFVDIVHQLTDYHYILTLHDVDVSIGSRARVEVYSRDYYHAYNDVGMSAGLNHIEDFERSTGRITDYMSGEYLVDEGMGENLNMVSYLIDGSIPYLYFSSFAICSWEENEENPGFDIPIDPSDDLKSEVLDNFESLVRNTPNMKGAIIDLRANGGGYNLDLDIVLGRFVNENEALHFGYTQHKSGPNRYDYTESVPCYINGTSQEESYLFPIVILADLWSVSMAEFTTIASRSFSDRSIMVGERTFGAISSLCADIYTAGGIIETDNFEIYTASCLFYDIDMNFYEGVGVTPDIEVLFEESTWGTTTTDRQKEVAIDYIKGL